MTSYLKNFLICISMLTIIRIVHGVDPQHAFYNKPQDIRNQLPDPYEEVLENVPHTSFEGVDLYTGLVKQQINLLELPGLINESISLSYTGNIRESTQRDFWKVNNELEIGIGWSLDNVRLIRRETKNTAILQDDGYTYINSGVEESLIFGSVTSEGGTTREIWLAQQKPDVQYIHIIQYVNDVRLEHWETRDLSSGEVATFGDTDASCACGLMWDEGSLGQYLGPERRSCEAIRYVREWHISTRRDAYGNALTYTYERHECPVGNGVEDNWWPPCALAATKSYTREIHLHGIEDSYGNKIEFVYAQKSVSEVNDDQGVDELELELVSDEFRPQHDPYQEVYSLYYLTRIEQYSRVNGNERLLKEIDLTYEIFNQLRSLTKITGRAGGSLLVDHRFEYDTGQNSQTAYMITKWIEIKGKETRFHYTNVDLENGTGVKLYQTVEPSMPGNWGYARVWNQETYILIVWTDTVGNLLINAYEWYADNWSKTLDFIVDRSDLGIGDDNTDGIHISDDFTVYATSNYFVVHLDENFNNHNHVSGYTSTPIIMAHRSSYRPHTWVTDSATPSTPYHLEDFTLFDENLSHLFWGVRSYLNVGTAANYFVALSTLTGHYGVFEWKANGSDERWEMAFGDMANDNQRESATYYNALNRETGYNGPHYSIGVYENYFVIDGFNYFDNMDGGSASGSRFFWRAAENPYAMSTWHAQSLGMDLAVNTTECEYNDSPGYGHYEDVFKSTVFSGKNGFAISYFYYPSPLSGECNESDSRCYVPNRFRCGERRIAYFKIYQDQNELVLSPGRVLYETSGTVPLSLSIFNDVTVDFDGNNLFLYETYRQKNGERSNYGDYATKTYCLNTVALSQGEGGTRKILLEQDISGLSRNSQYQNGYVINNYDEQNNYDEFKIYHHDDSNQMQPPWVMTDLVDVNGGTHLGVGKGEGYFVAGNSLIRIPDGASVDREVFQRDVLPLDGRSYNWRLMQEGKDFFVARTVPGQGVDHTRVFFLKDRQVVGSTVLRNSQSEEVVTQRDDPANYGYLDLRFPEMDAATTVSATSIAAFPVNYVNDNRVYLFKVLNRSVNGVDAVPAITQVEIYLPGEEQVDVRQIDYDHAKLDPSGYALHSTNTIVSTQSYGMEKYCFVNEDDVADPDYLTGTRDTIFPLRGRLHRHLLTDLDEQYTYGDKKITYRLEASGFQTAKTDNVRIAKVESLEKGVTSVTSYIYESPWLQTDPPVIQSGLMLLTRSRDLVAAKQDLIGSWNEYKISDYDYFYRHYEDPVAAFFAMPVAVDTYSQRETESGVVQQRTALSGERLQFRSVNGRWVPWAQWTRHDFSDENPNVVEEDPGFDWNWTENSQSTKWRIGTLFDEISTEGLVASSYGFDTRHALELGFGPVTEGVKRYRGRVIQKGNVIADFSDGSWGNTSTCLVPPFENRRYTGSEVTYCNFETGIITSQSPDNDYLEIGNANLSITTNAFSGSYAVSLPGDAVNNSYLGVKNFDCRQLALREKQTYVLSCWAKTTGSYANGQAYLSIYPIYAYAPCTVNNTGISGAPYRVTEIDRNNDEWVYYECEFDLSLLENLENVWLRFYINNRSSADILIDDILVYPSDASYETQVFDYERQQIVARHYKDGRVQHLSLMPDGKVMSSQWTFSKPGTAEVDVIPYWSTGGEPGWDMATKFMIKSSHEENKLTTNFSGTSEIQYNSSCWTIDGREVRKISSQASDLDVRPGELPLDDVRLVSVRMKGTEACGLNVRLHSNLLISWAPAQLDEPAKWTLQYGGNTPVDNALVGPANRLTILYHKGRLIVIANNQVVFYLEDADLVSDQVKIDLTEVGAALTELLVMREASLSCEIFNALGKIVQKQELNREASDWFVLASEWGYGPHGLLCYETLPVLVPDLISTVNNDMHFGLMSDDFVTSFSPELMTGLVSQYVRNQSEFSARPFTSFGYHFNPTMDLAYRVPAGNGITSADVPHTHFDFDGVPGMHGYRSNELRMEKIARLLPACLDTIRYTNRMGQIVQESLVSNFPEDANQSSRTSIYEYNDLWKESKRTQPNGFAAGNGNYVYATTYASDSHLPIVSMDPDRANQNSVYDLNGNLRCQWYSGENKFAYFVYDEMNRKIAEGYAQWSPGSINRQVIQSNVNSNSQWPRLPGTTYVDRRVYHYSESSGPFNRGTLEVIDLNADETSEVEYREHYRYDETGDLESRKLETTNSSGFGEKVYKTIYLHDDYARLGGINYPDARGTQVRYQYDNRSRLEKIGDPSVADRWAHYQYDGYGNLKREDLIKTCTQCHQTFAFGTDFEYDALNRLKIANRKNGHGLSIGFREELRYENGPNDINYGQIVHIYNDWARYGSGFDAEGPNTLDPNDFNIDVDYNGYGQMRNYRYCTESGVNNYNNLLDFNYDANGNIKQYLKQDSKVGQDFTQMYSYQNRNQVTSVAFGSGSNIYTYDFRGNQTKIVRPTVSLAMEYDVLLNQCTRTYLGKDKLQYLRYGYQSAGQRLFKESAKWVADPNPMGPEKQVGGVSVSVSGDWHVNRQLYLHDEERNAIVEIERPYKATEIQRSYIYGLGGIIETITCLQDGGLTPEKRHVQLNDYLGSTRLVFDENAEVVSSWTDYGPHGDVWIDSNTGFANEYTYTGQEIDQESESMNFDARLYDQETGLFFSLDSLRENDSPYSYVFGNPIMMKDRDGNLATGFSINGGVTIANMKLQMSIGYYSAPDGTGIIYSTGFGASSEFCEGELTAGPFISGANDQGDLTGKSVVITGEGGAMLQSSVSGGVSPNSHALAGFTGTLSLGITVGTSIVENTVMNVDTEIVPLTPPIEVYPMPLGPYKLYK